MNLILKKAGLNQLSRTKVNNQLICPQTFFKNGNFLPFASPPPKTRWNLVHASVYFVVGNLWLWVCTYRQNAHHVHFQAAYVRRTQTNTWVSFLLSSFCSLVKKIFISDAAIYVLLSFHFISLSLYGSYYWFLFHLFVTPFF